MTEHQTSRTLVKSPPELWAECSDAESLARHLDGFGEIRITRLEPETAVAWEGERASGTVRLEPSGWGTRVILTARSVLPEAATVAARGGAVGSAEEAEEAEEPVKSGAAGEEVPGAKGAVAAGAAPAEPAEPAEAGRPARTPVKAEGQGGFLARLFGFLRRAPAAEVSGEDRAEPDEQVLAAGELVPVATAHAEPAPGEPAPGEPAPDEPAAQEPAPVKSAAGDEPPTAQAPAAKAAPEPGSTEALLVATLDSLGQAHRRPFSRA